MLVADKQVEFHSRGLGDSVQYRVATTPKMMMMLSDALYKDKIAAPIRELGTNALDAHKMAGTFDKPFDVYLPTHLNREFVIRDYGTGMSREQLHDMYTTYGDSNKTHSNDYNGCMGIGSKSPFAYTNSFVTTSFYNGVKYVCINAKDEDGIPSLNFVVDGEPTDEPNGIEISFAVKETDTQQFVAKAAVIYHYFPVRPNCKRGTIAYQKRDVLFEGDGWRLLRDGNQSYAIMGYVGYPIESSHFSKNKTQSYSYWYDHDDNPEAQLLNMGIELDFGIGDVEMDMAREGLQYKKQSIDAVKAKLAVVLDHIKKEVEKGFKDCKTLWEARMRYVDLTQGKMAQLEKLTKVQAPTYNGATLLKRISLDDKFIPGTSLVKFSGYGRTTPKRYDNVDNLSVPSSAQESSLLFYENDLERGAYSACNRLFEADGQTGGKLSDIFLMRFNDAAAKKTFCDYMGFPETYIHKISEVPKLPKSERQPRENVFAYDLTSANSNSRYHSQKYAKDWWKKFEVDFEDGGVYAEINSFRVRKKDGTEVGSADIGFMLKVLESVGVKIPTEVIGVKTVVVKKYRKCDDWEDVFDYIDRKFKEYLKTQNLSELIANIEASIAYDDNDREIFKAIGNEISVTSLVYDHWKHLEELDKVRKDKFKTVENVREVARLLNMSDFLKGKAKYDLVAEQKVVHATYPMLDFLNRWDVEKNKKKIANYIALVDSTKEEK